MWDVCVVATEVVAVVVVTVVAVVVVAVDEKNYHCIVSIIKKTFN